MLKSKLKTPALNLFQELSRVKKFLKNEYALRKNDLYSRNFYKTHLIVNNGSFGTVFSVQSKETEECYAARHVKSKSVRGNLMVSNNCYWC